MDGVIIINKEKACTSHDVVYKIKKIFNKKVGHTGTLDPNATGVLPILVGKGTLVSKYLIEHDKVYEVVLKLGIKTDTADIEGKIVEEKFVTEEILVEDKIKEILRSFIGKQKQIPPMYSAIKVDGKKLYEYARNGKEVKIEPREIEIFDIKFNNLDKKNKEILFTVHCSKGTYIRSLCENIAEKMGTVGFMKELNRIKVGIFNIENSIKIEDLIQCKDDKEKLKKYFISIEELFQKNKLINLENNKLQPFLNGVKIFINEQDGVYRIYNINNFIGLGIVVDKKLKRDIII